MSDQSLELQGTTTGNEASEVQATTEAVVPDNKPASLDEAIKVAFAKHKQVDAEAPRTALPATEPAQTDAPAEPARAIDPITGRELEPIRAPAGWTPKLRERWGNIDREVQQFIIDRDKDMSNRLMQTADERKLASSFKEAAAPFESMLRQFNTTAVDHAKELFNLSYALNSGTPQAKAQVIVNLMQRFKPDPATMQQLLANPGLAVTTPPPAPGPVNVQAEVDRALAERDATAQQAQVQTELDAFESDPKNEFFADVRAMMGKILDAGLVPEGSLPEMFKKAYDLACAQHPEVAQILAARQSVAAPAHVPASKPVASVKPSLGAGKSAKAPARSMNMDDAIRQAMEQHGLSV